MKDKTINVSYFDVIDTPNKAYLLGFIAADGAIVANKGTTTKTLTITIQQRDEAVLHLLKAELNSSLDIRIIDHKSKSLSSYKLDVNHRRFNTSHRQIISALESHGITRNKSLTMPDLIANLPKKFRKSFIIGYFDGDGCFMDYQITRTRLYKKKNGTFSTYVGQRWNSHITIKGTREFLMGIVEELGIKTYWLKQHPGQKIHTLTIVTNEGISKFYDCYQYCDFFLQRKQEKFTRKILQVQTISSP